MTTRREYLKALDELEGRISAEFLDAVREAVRGAPIGEIESAIASSDIEAIARAVGLSSAALTMTNEAIRTAYLTAGVGEAQTAILTFDIRNPRAEQWLANQSSTLVTNIETQQLTAIRETLESGMRLGRHPRKVALDIAGRVGANGRRTGGIIGLTDQQASFVANARSELLSGDPKIMERYFSRTRRDKRFDSIVRKAISEERALADADIDRLIGRYSDRLLQLRAETIARTEAISAMNAARQESWDQAITDGNVRADYVIKTWRSVNDGRARHEHIEMNGQQVKFREPFLTPEGVPLMRPGDTSMGASGKDVINCRCFMEISTDNLAELMDEEGI